MSMIAAGNQKTGPKRMMRWRFTKKPTKTLRLSC